MAAARGGYIQQLPSGSFRVSVYAGTDPLTGRQIRLRKTCKTERAAQIELGKLLEQAAAGRQPETNATVAELMDRYAEVADWDLSTRKANEVYIRRVIKPALGHLRVRKIRGPLLGARRGELCALQVRDVDLVNGVLHIAFNYVVVGGVRARKDTKTYQDRYLAIDPVTCAMISEHLDTIRAELAAVGLELPDDAYVFSNDPMGARPWNPDWATHKASDLAAAACVKLSIKGLRHYTATVAGRVHSIEIRPIVQTCSCVLTCTVADATGEQHDTVA